MSIVSDSRVSRNPDLVHTEVDGYTMMMSIEAGKYFSLNRMGSRIWELIEQPAVVSDLVAILEREFEVESARCQAETSAFLDGLVAKGLVVVAPRP